MLHLVHVSLSMPSLADVVEELTKKAQVSVYDISKLMSVPQSWDGDQPTTRTSWGN